MKLILDLYERDTDQPFHETTMQDYDELSPNTVYVVDVPVELFRGRETIRVFVTVAK